MRDELPLDADTQVFTYISPGGWATRRLSEVRPELPAANPLVAWHVGEPKAPAYEGHAFRFVNSRRLSEDVIDDARWCAGRVWWARLFGRRFPNHAIFDAFEITPRELGLEGELPAPAPTAEPDLLALAAEAEAMARRAHEMYNALRPAHPYSYACAINARDALEELAKQLRGDALDFHPDVQGSGS